MNRQTIRKGSASWRELFYDTDPTASWGPNWDTDALRAMGDLSALLDEGRPKVLVAGTRDLDCYGKEAVHRVVGALAANPLRPVVVSGLAFGTDTLAHELALEAGLPTVAVLPTGLDTVYPYCNRDLARQIASTPGCALLTQFKDGTAPMAVNFLARNMTMAMITDIAVIPQTKVKGGAIVAARYMHERRRRVFAVPGRLGDVRSAGCNLLIERNIAEIYTEGYTEPFLKGLSVLRKSSEYVNSVTL